jgi:serine/threonine-protein kinase
MMGERETSGNRPSQTLAYTGSKHRPPALAETVAQPSGEVVTSMTQTVAVRTTVLPRADRTSGQLAVVVRERPRYEELRRLGSGGQAEVTLARDHDIERTVAVKRLLPERNDEASVLRFTEEIRTVGQLEHPNIVPIHDVGVDEAGHYFFVMKYCQGETLESIIEKLRAGDAAYLARYTPEYRLQICNEILRGVQHAHELGILHRDLKPGNVMVGSLGEVVVMDWGLAKRAGEPEAAHSEHAPAATERERLFQTQAGALLGTPAYMAPEQATASVDGLDARADVYALGVMFYEFLSLRHPRAHCETVAQMLASVAGEEISVKRLFEEFGEAGATAAAGHFVKHALKRDPKDRYPTVSAMRSRLDAVRDGRAPVECPITFSQRVLDGTSRGINRHPYLVIAGFVAAGMSLLGGSIWMLLR